MIIGGANSSANVLAMCCSVVCFFLDVTVRAAIQTVRDEMRMLSVMAV